MHVDVHCVACSSLHVAVHYQSLQAVTLQVASEDANTSLAQPNWDNVAKPKILNRLASFNFFFF